MMIKAGLPLAISRETRLKNNTEFARRVMLERYGRYPDDHPSVAFLKSILARINGKQKIDLVVTRNWNEYNAAALPDGTIFYSSKLFRLFEYEEEHAFVMRHEYEHIIRKHAQRIAEQGSEEGALWKRLLVQTGAARIAEYESDLRALLRSDEEGVNPYGALVATQRFIDAFEGAESDTIHGSDLVRLLNMQYVLRLVDMPTLSEDLTRVPDDIGNAIPSPRGYATAWLPGNHRELIENHELRKGDAKQSGLTSAYIDMATIYNDDAKNERFYGGRLSLDNRTRAQCDKDIMAILGKKIYNQIDEVFPELGEKDRRVMFGLVLELSAGCKILEFAELGVDLLGIAKDLVGVCKNPRKLVRFLGMLEKEKDNFYFNGKLPDFLKQAVRLQKENTVENEGALVRAKGALHRISEARGLEELDWTEAHTELAEYLLKGIKSKEKIPLFVAICEGINLSGIGKRRLFNSVKNRFGLSEEEAEELARDRFFGGVHHYTETKRSLRLLRVIGDDSICPFNAGKFSGAISILEPKFDEDKMYGARKKYCEAIVKESGAKTADEMLDALEPIRRELIEKKGNLSIRRLYAKQSEKELWDKIDTSLIDYLLLDIFFHIEGMPFAGEEKQDIVLKLLQREMIDFGYLQLYECLKWDEKKQITERILESDISLKHEAIAMMLRAGLEEAERDEFFMFLKSLRSLKTEMRDSSYAHSVYTIFARFEFGLSDYEQLDQFLEASQFIPDFDIRTKIQRLLLRKLLEILPKEEAAKLLFEDARVEKMEHLDIKEEFIEGRLRNVREIEETHRKVLGDFVPAERMHEKVATAILADYGIKELIEDPTSLLKQALSTAEGDEELVKDLYFVCGLDPSDLFATEYALQRAYNMDTATRYAATQILLVGENGALLSAQGRKELLGWFFDRFVEKPKDRTNEEVHQVLREAFMSVAERADVPTLYFIVAPLVAERLFRKPKKPTTLASVVKKDKRIHNEEKKRILTDMKGIAEDGGGNTGRARLLGHIADETYESRKMGPVEFVKKLSSQLGAPGVRFLQNLGLYAEIPEELQGEFSEVYDSVYGQTKLSAFHTLKRQWEGLLDSDVKFGRRIGGGSTFTVFELEGEEGKEVVKIANPNAEFRTNNTCAVLKEVLECNPRFAAASTLVDDIAQWLREDLTFAGSAQLEARFRGQNEGWKAEGNSYSIHVPEAQISENARVRREAFVEGINLTQAEALAERGHDVKAITSLLVQNSLAQIQNGIMHSDIHPGNIRISDDGGVTLLDRGYYIVLDSKDIEFIASLPGLIGDRKALAQGIASYLDGFEDNKNAGTKDISSHLAEALEKSSGSASAVITGMMVAVRKCGCKMPLKLTLTLKNAIALDRMSKMAGFEGGAVEAYFYRQEKS